MPIKLPSAKKLQTDTAHAWFVVCAAFWVNFLVEGSIYSFGPYLLPMIKDLKVSGKSVSLLQSLQFGCYQISGPLIAVLIDFLGFRKVSVMGGGITCLGYLLASFTSNYVLTIVSFSVMAGIGNGMMYTTAVLIVSFHFDKYRALATAITMAGSSAGSFSLPIIFNRCLSSYDRVTTLRLQAGLYILTILASLVYTMPNSHPEAAKSPRKSSSVMLEDTEAMMSQLQSASKETSQIMQEHNRSRCSLAWNYLKIHFKHSCNVTILVSPIVMCLCVSYFILFLGQMTPYVFIVERAKEGGISENRARSLLPVISVGALIGRFLAALTIFFPEINYIMVSACSVFLCGVISIVSSFVLEGNFFFQGAYALSFGVFAAISSTTRTSLLISCMGLENLTTVWGITRLFMGISGFLGIPLSYHFKVMFRLYAYSFAFAGSCFILSACILAIIVVVSKGRDVAQKATYYNLKTFSPNADQSRRRWAFLYHQLDKIKIRYKPYINGIDSSKTKYKRK